MNRRRLLLIFVFLFVFAVFTDSHPRAERPQATQKGKVSAPSSAECELLEEQARVEMLAGNDLRAMPYILEAARRGCDSPALRLLTNELLERYRTDFDIPGGQVVGFLADGRIAAIVGGGFEIWNPETRRRDSRTALDGMANLDFGEGGTQRFSTVSPDGKYFFSVISGRPMPFAGFQQSSNSVTPQYLYPHGKPSSLGLWDTTTGRIVWQRETLDPLRAKAEFDPSGKRLAVFDGKARVLDLSTRTLSDVLGEKASRGCFSPDGTLLATVGRDGYVGLWNPVSGTEVLTLTGHEKYVISCEFDSTGEQLLTNSDDGTSRLWSIAVQRCLKVWMPDPSPDSSGEARFVQNSRIVRLNRTGGAARIWFPPTYAENVSAPVPSSNKLWKVLPVPGSNDLLSIEYDRHEGAKLCLGSNPREIHGLGRKDFDERMCFVSPNGKYVASAFGQVWEIGKRTKRFRLLQMPAPATSPEADTTLLEKRVFRPLPRLRLSGLIYVSAMDISDDGRWCVSADTDEGWLRVMDLDTGDVRLLPTDDNETVYIKAVDVDDHGDCAAFLVELALGAEKRQGDVLVFAGGRKVLEIPAEGKTVNRIRVGADGKRVAVGYQIGVDGSDSRRDGYDVWDVQTGRKVVSRNLDGAWLMDFSPDGSCVAVFTERKTLAIRKLDGTGETEMKLPPDFLYQKSILSPDNGSIAWVSGWSTNIGVWNVNTGEATALLENRSEPRRELIPVGWDAEGGFIVASSDIPGPRIGPSGFAETSLWNRINGKRLLILSWTDYCGGRMWLRNGNLIIQSGDDLVIRPISRPIPAFEEVRRVLSPYLVYRLEGNTTLVPVTSKTKQE